MAFNIFQKSTNKKPADGSSRRRSGSSVARKNKTAVAKQDAVQDVVVEAKSKNRAQEKNTMASRYLVSPHISEKASTLQTPARDTSGASYTFRVTKTANKQLLKKAVEDRYDVKVVSVRIINTRAKEVRRGKITGHKPGYKKAIVTLLPGNTIEQL